MGLITIITVKNKYFAIFLVVAVIIVVFIGIYIRSQSNLGGEYIETRYSNYTLPISERAFYIGLVPTPRNSPNSSFDDIVAAYEEAGEIAEICMIWVGEQGIGEYDLLKKNRVIEAARTYGLKVLVTLNFATIRKVEDGLKYVIDAPGGIPANLSDPVFRSRWVEEAKKIASEFKPEYFSLGNEINDYFYLHPGELDDYLSLFEEAKNAIKSVSPDTKVFVVFSYNHLIENNQWSMLEEFNDKVDLIGLTTYPWKQFETSQDIPDDYYLRLRKYVSKPIAFTEIGWVSDPPGSDKQQSEFLLRFLELTKGLDIEMVNWLFLHEIQIQGTVGMFTNPRTGTISLKKSDGIEKDIYRLWLDLKKLPLEETE